MAASEPPAPIRNAANDAFNLCGKDGMKASNINGYLYPPFISQQGVDWLCNNWHTQAHDVIVASYPKTGTMWTLNIVVEMIKQAYPSQRVFNTIKQAEWIENMACNKGKEYFTHYTQTATKYDAVKCPKRVWQTHAFFSQFPCKSLHRDSRIIYVTRCPKDVIVSSFHFFSKEQNIAFTGDFNAYFECFCDGITPNGNYFDHVMEWYRVWQNARKLGVNVLFLYYEDMKANLLNEIKKIAAFIGCDELLNEQQYKLIERNSTFDAMKEASKSDEVHLSPSFFRKGSVSDWRNYLDEKQSKRIDRLIRARFHGTNIKYFGDLMESENNHKPQLAKL